jgi:hypothetical protein
MNERIKELEAQCWESRQYGPPWFDSQKFAELIVKECVKIAYQNDIAKFTRDGYIIGMDIQKHFGVEE